VSAQPPAQAVEAALATMAEELRRLYPRLDVQVHRPGQEVPAGARRLPAVSPVDVEAVGDRPTGKRRADDDPLDE
jgi:hypothetical protein